MGGTSIEVEMDLHPDKYGYAIPNDCTTQGRNRNDGAIPESGFLRCKKCGFILNKHITTKGWGDGINLTDFKYGSQNKVDPTVQAGCPFCGTFNYD